MREAGVFNFEREVWKAANTPLLLIDDAQPAEPFAFIAVGPQRSILRPQPPHFVFGVPIIERRLNSRRQVLRQREGLLIKVFRHFLDKINAPRICRQLSFKSERLELPRRPTLTASEA